MRQRLRLLLPERRHVERAQPAQPVAGPVPGPQSFSPVLWPQAPSEARARYFSSPTQPGSSVSGAGIDSEQEADRLSEQVLGASPSASLSASIRPLAPTPERRVPEHVTAVLNGGGKPLEEPVRGELESRFGQDFSAVRVHTGAAANASAQSLRARAYTRGSHVVFRDGAYAPGTASGKKLLAHELTHVVQQSAGAHSHTGNGPLQRAPDAPGKAARPAPPTAAQAQKNLKAPIFSDYFDAVVPAILEAVEQHGGLDQTKALFLIMQSYGEQGPGTGLPSQHHNRLFNEHAAVTRDNKNKITGVVPGQEEEGVHIYDLNQNESPTRDQQKMMTSPTFGYDTPTRATEHHLKLLEKRYGGAYQALTNPKASFEEYTAALKRAKYAEANDYDTYLNNLQHQVRSQVRAWLKFRIPQLEGQISDIESDLIINRLNLANWQERLTEEPAEEAYIQQEIARYQALIASLEQRLEKARADLRRLKAFAPVLK